MEFLKEEELGYFTKEEYEFLEIYHSRTRLIHDLMFDLEESTEEAEPIMQSCIRKLKGMSDKEYKDLFLT